MKKSNQAKEFPGQIFEILFSDANVSTHFRRNFRRDDDSRRLLRRRRALLLRAGLPGFVLRSVALV
jgi:hypothetical protein